MSKQKINTSTSIITRDLDKIAAKTEGNIYEALVVISKRARQVAAKTKEELATKLADFSTGMDNLEEMHENREQIEISKHYERLPKSTSTAIDEFLDDKLVFGRVTENEEEAGL